ncbi:MAG TPA: M20/M25/M40 family metallo-hydrolase [Acidimicrobiia bacterium]|nr:M20/M25/M40 family metallo-hydrolase [Acidimicrobiia bacterium]
MRVSPLRATVLVVLLLSLALPAGADNGTPTAELREAVTTEGILEHLEAFDAIADANGGTRAAGTPGYEASAEYVEELLTAAGYEVSRQTFTYDRFAQNSPSVLEQTAPGAVAYVDGVDFFIMTYSGNGDVTAPVQAVDLLLPSTGGSTSGCEAEDFASFTEGNIALIQRGTCTFRVKAENASAAGAVGVIIFNEGNAEDRIELFGGTLDPPAFSLPVVSASFELGVALNDLIDEGLVVHLATDATLTPITTFNVLADTPTGRSDRLVVVGAHLDSVPEGPGVNDNGSGSAAILETALQIAELGIEPRNMIRFAFWGGEEDGLIGSEYYVSHLSKDEIKDHAVNLNFDMVGSPNYVRFVYDGDGSPTGTAGPNGSGVVEDVFLDYFDSQGLAAEPTAFDGRSDYGPFIAVGIPAGGLFTGAEEIKTAEQAVIYGGTAGIAYDPCYHLACDDIDNVNVDALDEMSDAIAHATLVFADTSSAVQGTGKGQGSGQSNLEFRGNLRIR